MRCGCRYHCPSADRAPGQLGAWAQGCGLGHSGRAFWKLPSLPLSVASSPCQPIVALDRPILPVSSHGLWPGEGLGSPPVPAALEEAVGVRTSRPAGLHRPWCTLDPTIPGCRFHFGSFFCLGVWRRWSFRSVCWLHQAWGTRRQVHARVGGWHGGAGGSGGARPRAASTLPTRCLCWAEGRSPGLFTPHPRFLGSSGPTFSGHLLRCRSHGLRRLHASLLLYAPAGPLHLPQWPVVTLGSCGQAGSPGPVTTTSGPSPGLSSSQG